MVMPAHSKGAARASGRLVGIFTTYASSTVIFWEYLEGREDGTWKDVRRARAISVSANAKQGSECERMRARVRACVGSTYPPKRSSPCPSTSLQLYVPCILSRLPSVPRQ